MYQRKTNFATSQKRLCLRRIADTLRVSRNTVAKVFKAFEKHPISEDSLNTLNDQELLKSGVTLNY